MNILFISDVNIYPIIGGAERVLSKYCFGLLKKGHNILLLTRSNNDKKEEEFGGIKIFYYNINEKNKISFFISSFINSKKIFSKIIKNYKIDVINIHQPLSGFSLRKIKNIPIIYTFLSPWGEEYKSREKKIRYFDYYIRKIIEKKVLNKSDKIIVLSKFSKMQLQNIHNVKDEKIKIIPGGYDKEKFRRLDKEDIKNFKEKLNIKDRKILFTVRNLVSRMGLEELLKAFAILYHKKSYKDLFLIVGGEGELKRNLISLAEELNISDNVRFVGYIPEDDLPLYYNIADLFILPTKELEGFGLVIVESLGCGNPVLGTPVGAIPEVLEKFDRRFILKGKDSISIAEGIEKYFKELAGKEIRDECEKFAQENYTWEKIIEEVNYYIQKE